MDRLRCQSESDLNISSTVYVLNDPYPWVHGEFSVSISQTKKILAWSTQDFTCITGSCQKCTLGTQESILWKSVCFFFFPSHSDACSKLNTGLTTWVSPFPRPTYPITIAESPICQQQGWMLSPWPHTIAWGRGTNQLPSSRLIKMSLPSLRECVFFSF